jgi:hypothetical protein
MPGVTFYTLPPHSFILHCRCCRSAVAARLPPQEQRNILAIAVGLRGIAAIRAVLNCAAAQPHTTIATFA